MNKKYLLLMMIFLLGFLLRFWQIEDIPPGLNRDEASIGYTAYSLLKTGKDEYGVVWPLSFKSFGDWKLPLYIYLTTPFIQLFGLTDAAVRLPSVIFGSLTVFTTFLLAKELFKNQKRNTNHRWIAKIPLLSALFFALSPWSIHLSRNASESNTAVFLTSIGLLLYLKSINKKIYLLIGTIFLALPLYTYHGNHIFTLLLFAGLTVLFWKQYKSKVHCLTIAIFLVLSLFIYSKTFLVADKTKISGLFAAGDIAVVYKNIVTDRLQHTNPAGFISVFLHNKLFFTVLSAWQNYVKSFSVEFLFITGGENTQHNIPDFGNLYLWTAPFLFLGIAYLLTAQNDKKYLILLWLLLAPLPGSITKDAPHTNRMAAILPLFEILIAYGFIMAMHYLTNNAKNSVKLAIYFITSLFILNALIWCDRYFIHFPNKMEASWGGGYKELTSTLSSLTDQYPEIIMDRPDYSPYIYFLFYQKFDPSTFQKQVIRYPEDKEGFQHVKSIGNLSFKKLDWADDSTIPDRMLISWSESTPKNATNSGILVDNLLINHLQDKYGQTFGLQTGDHIINRLIKIIKLKNGQPQFYLIEVKKVPQGNFAYEEK